MEFYYERFIRVKITGKKKMMVLLLFIAAILIMPLSALAVFILTGGVWIFGVALMFAEAYLIYRLLTGVYVEYEYQFSNIVGSTEFVITKIINQKKRKLLLSLNCKEFEVVARLNGPKYSKSYESLNNKYECVKSMQEEDIFFIITHTEKGRTIIYVQLNDEMIEGFKKTIPSKFFAV